MFNQGIGTPTDARTTVSAFGWKLRSDLQHNGGRNKLSAIGQDLRSLACTIAAVTMTD